MDPIMKITIEFETEINGGIRVFNISNDDAFRDI